MSRVSELTFQVLVLHQNKWRNCGLGTCKKKNKNKLVEWKAFLDTMRINSANLKVKCLFQGLLLSQLPGHNERLQKAMHGHHRGHGFKSHTGLNFFQALFSLLLWQYSSMWRLLANIHFLNCTEFTVIDSLLQRFSKNQHSNQLPVGLLAQLVEHCISIVEVMGSNHA